MRMAHLAAPPALIFLTPNISENNRGGFRGCSSGKAAAWRSGLRLHFMNSNHVAPRRRDEDKSLQKNPNLLRYIAPDFPQYSMNDQK
jgi:hypothetical protein